MGTVVFTDAELKIFLTASVQERAERRYKQLIQKGVGASLPHLSAEIAERESSSEWTSNPGSAATTSRMIPPSFPVAPTMATRVVMGSSLSAAAGSLGGAQNA